MASGSTTLGLIRTAVVVIIISALLVRFQGSVGSIQNSFNHDQRPNETRSSTHFYVLGAVTGTRIGDEDVAVFVHSWTRFSPHTRQVLFVDNTTSALSVLKNAAESRSTILITPNRNASLPVHVERFYWYADFIKEHQASIHGVMIADVRDVAVQSDVWADPIVRQALDANGVVFSMEGGLSIGGSLLIGGEKYNSEFVRACFDTQVLRQLADSPVSCSGTVLGTAHGMLLYLDRMLKTLQTSSCMRLPSHDQGVHNYVLHVLSKKETESKRFLTPHPWINPMLAGVYSGPLTIDEAGLVTRVKGSAPAILHQYDRSHQIRDRLVQMYHSGQKVTLDMMDCRSEGCRTRPFTS
jgi:hypothetical protein